jgi:CPA2 family monovalent cation:H+ antiporter-2
LIAQSGATGGRVILCGYGSFGEAVSARLADVGIDHTIITNNTDAYVRANEAGKNVVFGDASDRVLLESLKIREVMSTVIAIDDFEKVKRVRAAITLMDPELKVIARVATEEDKLELTEFNHELLLDGNSHTASVLVDQISRSRLLALETSRLKYLCDYSVDDPSKAIELVTLEQARLLDIISKSFNGLREERDILYIKALHDSFDVLSEIIGNAIADVMKNASLSPSEYERINTLLDNQQQLISMNDTLVDLAKNLKSLERVDQTQKFSLRAVEGLDAVLLSLKDIANDYNKEDMEILRGLTSDEKGGISKIRQSYLGEEKNLDRQTKALLLSSTTNMSRLKQMFRAVGANYLKLAQKA